MSVVIVREIEYGFRDALEGLGWPMINLKIEYHLRNVSATSPPHTTRTSEDYGVVSGPTTKKVFERGVSLLDCPQHVSLLNSLSVFLEGKRSFKDFVL